MSKNKPIINKENSSQAHDQHPTGDDMRDLGHIGRVVTTAIRNRSATDQEVEKLLWQTEGEQRTRWKPAKRKITR